MSSSSKETKESSSKEKRRSRKSVKTDHRGSDSKSSLSHSTSPERKRSRVKKVTDTKQSARALFFHEENTVDQHDPIDDIKQHAQTCDNFRSVLDDIRDLKLQGDLSSRKAAELDELKTDGALQFIILRKMNRLSHFRCKKVRDSTHEAKQRIDQHHLQLQNLLYEIMHLQREITKCLQFKSNDEDVNLVTVDDFYNDAPAEIAKPEITKKDLHQQTLARLDWELTQRKKLSEHLKEKQQAKDEVKTEIQIKADFLDSLQPKLNTILESTKPVQEYLGMPFDEIRQQHRSAAYLPRPLYVLFMQASAFHDACDKNLVVSIEGDLEEAKTLDQHSIELSKNEDDSESDGEEQEKEQTKKRRHSTRVTECSTKKLSNKDQLLRQHPLTVLFHVKFKESSVSLHLRFRYLLMLEIVTVNMQLQNAGDDKNTSISGGDLLSSDSLLNCLYPDDVGTETPNASNKYPLQKYGLGEFASYVSDVGRPYQWVQWLCGLQFLADGTSGTPPGTAQPAVSATYMEETVRRLRRRVKARRALQQQLVAIEKCTVPVTTEYIGLFPAKISSSLSSWKRSTYEDFSILPYCQGLIQSAIAKSTDVYFTAILERASARMTVQVVLPSEYPVAAPTFALSLMWKGEKTNINDPNIRDMECEVNVFYDELVKEKSHDQLLSNQLQRLLMCMDVYLETEALGMPEGPCEFARDKIFPRTSKGPHRIKPYFYNSQLGFFGQR